MDVAGTVEAVGQNVTRFQAGDDVYGVCDGSFADYATARVETLAAKPARLTFEQAAAIPTSACTALQALRDAGKIAAGQRVLIIGASGGVGLFAVQIAKAYGAEVTGVCSTGKVELVRSVGADHVIDYTEDDVTTSGQRYDLILDMGGNRTLSELRRCLTPRGTLVLVGGEGGGRLIGGAMGRSLRALALSPFVHQNLKMVLGTTKADDLDDPHRADREQRDHPGHRPHLSARRGRRRHPASPQRSRSGKARHHRLRRPPPTPYGRRSTHRIPPSNHQEIHHADPSVGNHSTSTATTTTGRPHGSSACCTSPEWRSASPGTSSSSPP